MARLLLLISNMKVLSLSPLIALGVMLMLSPFLSLVSINFLFAGDPLRPERVSRYQYRQTSYDFEPVLRDGRRGDGKHDTFIFESYDGKPITKLYDFNADGEIDTTQEWFRLENLEIEVRDRNFDQRLDLLIYTYPQRQYLLADRDDDGYIDRLVVKKCQIKTAICEDSSEQSYKIYVKASKIEISPPIPVSPSALFIKGVLLETLLGHSLVEEGVYVSQESTEKRRELQVLLDKREWENLLKKTMEYLDFPSDLLIKVMIIARADLPKGEHQQTRAQFRFPNIFYICPELIGDRLDIWLDTVDHEMLHALQNRKIFYHLRKTETSWEELAARLSGQSEFRSNLSPQEIDERVERDSRIVKEIPIVLSFRNQNILHAELEAYLYQLRRVVLYHSPDFDEATFQKSLFAHIYYDLIQENGLSELSFFRHVIEDARRLLPAYPISPDKVSPQIYLQMKLDTAKSHFPVVGIKVKLRKK